MDSSDDRLKALTDSVADHVRATLERELASMVSEAVARERTAADDRLKATVEAARAEWLVRERQASLAGSERLLGVVQALDNAASLSDVLDCLVAAARDEAGRAALVVVKGPTLRGWAHAGFADDMLPAAEISVPESDPGLLGAALRAKDRTTSTDLPTDSGSPFMLSSDDRVGIAVPLVVDAEVVGVLYADDDGEVERAVPSAWPESIELLVRHAGRCLESLTARGASATAAVKAVATESTRTDEEGAQRFARLLVSEIKLYHAPLVDEGRQARDLRQRLHDQIARARQLYEEKVSPAIRRHADYFELELVRTLADGDPVLLGQRS